MQARQDHALRTRVASDSTWQRQIVLPAGASLPKRSARDIQRVFRSVGCNHLRIMLPESASKRSLTCKICTSNAIMKAHKMAVPSALERKAYEVMTRCPVSAIWATEVSFSKCAELRKSKADLVLFRNVDGTCLRSSLLVFLDGQGHFCSRPNGRPRDHGGAEQQREVDERISRFAAEHGYKVLRVSYMDISNLYRILMAAWARASAPQGWVHVSRTWNLGALPLAGALECLFRHAQLPLCVCMSMSSAHMG